MDFLAILGFPGQEHKHPKHVIIAPYLHNLIRLGLYWLLGWKAGLGGTGRFPGNFLGEKPIVTAALLICQKRSALQMSSYRNHRVGPSPRQ